MHALRQHIADKVTVVRMFRCSVSEWLDISHVGHGSTSSFADFPIANGDNPVRVFYSFFHFSFPSKTRPRETKRFNTIHHHLNMIITFAHGNFDDAN